MLKPVGVHKSEIDTPALVVDLDAMERNIRRMGDYFANRPAKLRPHVKTHKCSIIAHKQIDAGARGVTCAKLGEAEVMVASGIRDILIANQIVGKEKIARLASLARHASVIVAADNASNLQDLSDAALAFGSEIGVVVEVDVGMGRCGTRSVDETVSLARLSESLKGIRFRGLMGYEGHCVFIQDRQERVEKCHLANSMLVEAAEAVRRGGVDVEIVSGGGTGTYDITGDYPGITEVEAGSYVFMDARYIGVIEGFEPALTLMATVISRPTKDIAIIDAGLKAVTNEFGMPVVKGVRGAEVVKLSEEHGKIHLSEDARDLKPGDKVELIPSHGCTTINLHDFYFGVRGDRLETVWSIAARGKVR
ncbi:MAG: DSD1 family PLP-dependent enzyme [Firmicutes bacterium]|nr:DSD1 family PLP-dependent enzyme [Bacillota bacterium]MDH7494755.1 DSD1 family PLP-dependent enzyme [Bacillota bacterium]